MSTYIMYSSFQPSLFLVEEDTSVSQGCICQLPFGVRKLQFTHVKLKKKYPHNKQRKKPHLREASAAKCVIPGWMWSIRRMLLNFSYMFFLVQLLNVIDILVKNVADSLAAEALAQGYLQNLFFCIESLIFLVTVSLAFCS